MSINSAKSTVMKICKSKTVAFPAEVRVNGTLLEIKNEVKILGVILMPNLKWGANTRFICKKAYNSMWLLRRMKKLGLDTCTLTEYFMKEVRVHLELAVPVWQSGLTKKLSSEIERVQKIAINIILGHNEYSYARACSVLGLTPLHIRREKLCERFSLKTASKSRHSDLFQLEKNNRHGHDTRSKNDRYRGHKCRKVRFYNSPLPFLTRTLNQL